MWLNLSLLLIDIWTIIGNPYGYTKKKRKMIRKKKKLPIQSFSTINNILHTNISIQSLTVLILKKPNRFSFENEQDQTTRLLPNTSSFIWTRHWFDGCQSGVGKECYWNIQAPRVVSFNGYRRSKSWNEKNKTKNEYDKERSVQGHKRGHSQWVIAIASSEREVKRIQVETRLYWLPNGLSYSDACAISVKVCVCLHSMYVQHIRFARFTT